MRAVALGMGSPADLPVRNGRKYLTVLELLIWRAMTILMGRVASSRPMKRHAFVPSPSASIDARLY